MVKKKDHAFILMNSPNEKCGSSIAHKSFLFPIDKKKFHSTSHLNL